MRLLLDRILDLESSEGLNIETSVMPIALHKTLETSLDTNIDIEMPTRITYKYILTDPRK